MSQIKEIRSQKAKFENKVIKWLSEHGLCSSDIDDIVLHGPTLLSTGKSRHTSCSGSKSVKSGSNVHINSPSVLRTKAFAKQELARLRIAQLQEEQKLSQELKDLEEKRQKVLGLRREAAKRRTTTKPRAGNAEGKTSARPSYGRKTGLRGRIRAGRIHTTRQINHCRATMVITTDVHNTTFKIL